jgi:hypothetical protein
MQRNLTVWGWRNKRYTVERTCACVYGSSRRGVLGCVRAQQEKSRNLLQALCLQLRASCGVLRTCMLYAVSCILCAAFCSPVCLCTVYCVLCTVYCWLRAVAACFVCGACGACCVCRVSGIVCYAVLCFAGTMHGEVYGARRLLYAAGEDVLLLQSFGTIAAVVSCHHFGVNLLVNYHKHPLVAMCVLPTVPELALTLDSSGTACVVSIATSNNCILAPLMQSLRISCGTNVRHVAVLQVRVCVWSGVCVLVCR